MTDRKTGNRLTSWFIRRRMKICTRHRKEDRYWKTALKKKQKANMSINGETDCSLNTYLTSR